MPIMGPNGSGKGDAVLWLAGKADYEVTEGDVLLDGESILGMEPDERAAKGLFLAFRYPIEIPGVATMTFLRTARRTRSARRAARAGAFDTGIHEEGARHRRPSSKSIRTCSVARSMSVSRAVRRSATRFFRWPCWSRVLRCSTRPIPVSTSTR